MPRRLIFRDYPKVQDVDIKVRRTKNGLRISIFDATDLADADPICDTESHKQSQTAPATVPSDD